MRVACSVVAAAGVAWGLVFAAPVAAWQPAAQDSFPHLAHQGLFPLCLGCHTGIEDGDPASAYPEPESCAGCHDGTEAPRVIWTPSPRSTGFLDFSHPAHTGAVGGAGGTAIPCASCHVAPEGPRMAVVPLDPAGCLACHGTDPDAHYEAGTDCASCHRPLARAADGEARLADLPRPANHEGDAFLLAHLPDDGGGVARCATCHTQDRCAACHVDADREPILALPPAPADWVLPAMTAHYPVPDDHRAEAFEVTHGRPAPAAADCSTCHTRDDCAACHLPPLPPSAAALPPRPASSGHVPPPQERLVRGPGVGLESGLPGSHESPFFMTSHPTVAAAQPESCAGCHAESYCAECHDAPRAPGYHPPDFAMRHAAAVGSAPMECSNCHNTQAFCRQCHVEVGFGSEGRLGPGYHDAEPLWLLRHGQGARQGLEQCASCHTQRECLQCHSQLGAFKVSPHGPDFDPERARSRNPWICSACHIGGFGGVE